jgi:hypothetical protein
VRKAHTFNMLLLLGNRVDVAVLAPSKPSA